MSASASNTEPTDERFLPSEAVKQLTSLSRQTIWRLVRRGEFPAPVRLSPGRVAYPASAVKTWVAEKMRAA